MDYPFDSMYLSSDGSCYRCGSKGYVTVDRSESFDEYVPCCGAMGAQMKKMRDRIRELEALIQNVRATLQAVEGG